ncbi:MAG TPA: T9SS type A sorting domain-containing protein, partial [Chryseolinea sp.]
KSTVIIEKNAVDWSIPHVSACQGETVTLQVNSIPGVLAYYWFESEESVDTLARGASWTPPPLQKSQTFYVSAALSSGCDTGRLPVSVHITNFDAAKITLIDSGTLSSSYLSGNEWLLNGELVSNESKLWANQTGTYVLRVDTLGCVSSDTLEFIATVEPTDLKDIKIYPNPVNDYLNFPLLDGPAQVDIIENSGKVCLNLARVDLPPQQKVRIDVKGLSEGTYFAVIRMGQRKKIIKFIKAE